MSQKANRLKSRIQTLEAEIKSLRTANGKLKESVKQAETRVAKAMADRPSIIDMIGGFKLRLISPDHLSHLRFEEYRLQVSIMPEAYSQAFWYGSGGNDFRNFSRFVHMVGDDLRHKVERLLAEHADKMNGRDMPARVGVRGSK